MVHVCIEHKVVNTPEKQDAKKSNPGLGPGCLNGTVTLCGEPTLGKEEESRRKARMNKHRLQQSISQLQYTAVFLEECTNMS